MGNDNNNDTFLAKWLNNELTKEEMEAFQQMKDYKVFVKIAEKSTQFEIPTFDQKGIKNEIKKATQKEAKGSKTKVRTLLFNLSIAASVAVLFTVIGFSYRNNKETVLTADIGTIQAFTLPDGSLVTLNGNSSVTFKKNDWKQDERTLLLKGEGYFKVKKGSTFTVKSNQGTVTVLGTQFNVKTIPHFFEVQCYEGKVEVVKEQYKTILTPHKGVYYKKEKQYTTTFTNHAPNWENKTYLYNELPLQVVFNDLQNIYSLSELTVSTVDISKEFTGRLVTNDLKKALDIICKPMNLKYTLLKNKVTITSK